MDSYTASTILQLVVDFGILPVNAAPCLPAALLCSVSSQGPGPTGLDVGFLGNNGSLGPAVWIRFRECRRDLAVPFL